MPRKNNKANSSMIFTSRLLLSATILFTVWQFFDDSTMKKLLHLSNQTWHDWFNDRLDIYAGVTTLPWLITAPFRHAKLDDVVIIMLTLCIAGGRVFFVAKDIKEEDNASKASFWAHPLAFVWIYFGSYALSIGTCQWLTQGFVDSIAASYDMVSKTPFYRFDLFLYHAHWMSINALSLLVQGPLKIGSSTAVYGVVGADVFTSLHSPTHPSKWDEFETWVTWLCYTLFALRGVATLSLGGFTWHLLLNFRQEMFGLLWGYNLAKAWDTTYNRCKMTWLWSNITVICGFLTLIQSSYAYTLKQHKMEASPLLGSES